jgi:hypothetical protein
MMRIALALASTLAFAACSAEVAAPPPAAGPPPPDLLHDARAAAEIAMRNLKTRNFPLDACDSQETRIVDGEDTARRDSNGGSSCTLLAFRQPAGQWVVVIRSGMKASNPQARVVVGKNLLGVQRVDYLR